MSSVIKLASFSGPIDNPTRKDVFADINAWFIKEKIMPTCIVTVTIVPTGHERVEVHILYSPLKPQAGVQPIQMRWLYSPTSGLVIKQGSPVVERFTLDVNELLATFTAHGHVLHRPIDPVVYVQDGQIQWRLFVALVYGR